MSENMVYWFLLIFAEYVYFCLGFPLFAAFVFFMVSALPGTLARVSSKFKVGRWW